MLKSNTIHQLLLLYRFIELDVTKVMSENSASITNYRV